MAQDAQHLHLPTLLPVMSVLGDSSQWESHCEAAADVDFDDDAQLSQINQPSESAAAGVIADQQGAVYRAQQSAAAAASFVKESAEIELQLLKLPYEAEATNKICAILDEYQEMCELLDPHLPHAITTLMNYVHSIIRPGKVNPVPPANSTTGAIREEEQNKEKYITYQPNGAPCKQNELLTRVFKIIYTLAKVRGYKTIIHFFPHEVADLEPTLALLQQQDMEEYDTWETRYGLLLWLSIIVLIPFDLTTVDSSMTQLASDSAAAPARAGIIQSLISLGERYMSDTGPPREAAAVMLAKLFSRADMHASHLAAFFRWCTSEMTRIASEQASSHASSKNIFQLTGILKCLVEIFKYAPRDVLLGHVHLIYEPILKNDARWAKSTNTLLRKLFIKLAQRVGLTYLPARVANWRYQRGHRSLLTTLQQAAGGAAAAHNPMLGSSHAVPTPAAAAPSEADSDADENDVPSEIEDIIQILLDGLRDRDTVVRWSGAKGIGRITNCLPASFGDDVVAAVLDLFSGRESDGAWHGGCLALAELARRGLLLPERLTQVVPITLKALTYDQRTPTHSIGAHVRDASCYVQWAFARAYAPDVMTPYMQSLASGLLTICVFDREVNVRRASSAAFQEHVGRQGSASFKHGMDILQIADYFTVSNRSNAYTNVAFEVARYTDYTLSLIEHLLHFKVKHWEKEIRTLTAKTLGILTKRNDIARTFMKEVAVRSLLNTAVKSNDISEKHGAVLAVAEIVLALHQLDPNDYIDVSLRVQVCDVLNTLTSPSSAQLLNGRGGQIMRESICHLIEVVAQVALLYTNAHTMAFMRPYQSVLDENLGHTNAEVQDAAILGVQEFVRAYYLPLSTDDAATKAQKLARAKPVMDNYVRTIAHPSSLAGATRGFAAALGTLPRDLLVTSSVQATEVYSAASSAAAASAAAASSSSPSVAPVSLPPSGSLIYQPLSRILQTLIVASTECGQADAETRRNSIQSLVKLMATLNDEDITQFMTPMPNPPNITPAAATPNTATGSAAISAAREKELKALQKAQKLQMESINKYWHRDLVELGIPGNRICDRVATALLIGLDDYATDNRGDVGSWVREASMVGLDSLLLKLARIQLARPDTLIYPPLLSQRVFPALLKQAVEKIDRVREKSGAIFQKLLWHATPEIPYIPIKETLRERFPNTSNIDWSSPSQTFPLLTPLLSAASADGQFPYHRSILSGLLISVGGLTESVVKCSSDAFIAYVSRLSASISSGAADSAASLALLQLLAADLLYILELEKGHARVIVPAFKTLETLLNQNLLEALTLEV